jgi:hypothetical protein
MKHTVRGSEKAARLFTKRFRSCGKKIEKCNDAVRYGKHFRGYLSNNMATSETKLRR